MVLLLFAAGHTAPAAAAPKYGDFLPPDRAFKFDAALERGAVVLRWDIADGYYLPKPDVRMELLRPTNTRTACPYKGVTSQYWTVATGHETLEDAAWCYEQPRPEAIGVAGRICFYDEKMALLVDNEPQS